MTAPQAEIDSTITRLKAGQKWLAIEYESLLKLGVNSLRSEQETGFLKQLQRWAEMESLLRVMGYKGCIWPDSSCMDEVKSPQWVGRCSYCTVIFRPQELVAKGHRNGNP